ncbi:Capsular exopolysaccharide family protein [Devosia sp. LC5]|uniref:GumC family protein n=1 Tax=Devosia sp. LC5 TaxID=1502724 RepID=UPI0004E40CF1|nr:GumC family protein [Devosia sp. LC5]KFC70681.1 Capsular exopolysaccharide family protein [Devosia sp. LC5]
MFRSDIVTETATFIGPVPSVSPALGDYLGQLWRARYWAGAGALCCAAFALAAPLVLTPSYRASAQIFIDPQNLQVLERDLTPSTASGDAGVVLIESQARVMASDSVLRAAATQLDLQNDPEFIGRPNPLRALLDSLAGGASDAPRDDLSKAVLALSKAVHVVRLDRTYVVDIHAESESATKAAAIANAVVSNYLGLRETQRAAQAERASGALEGRLAQLLGELESAENAVERFKTANGIVETGGQSLLEGEVGQTNQALLAADNALAAARVERDQLQALAANSEQAAAAPEAMGSADITRLRDQLQTANADVAVLRATLGAQHPRLIVAEQRVTGARAALDAEVARLLIAADLALQRARDNASALRSRLENATANLQATDAKRIRLRQLEREAEASRAVYQDALLRSRETAEQARLDTLNAQVVSQAAAPSERSFPPKPSMLLPLGLIVGLLLGGALGMLVNRWRGH